MRKNIAPLMLLTLMAVSPLALTSAQAQDAVVVPTATAVVAGNMYISLNGLRARSTPDDAGKTMGVLSLNEVVRVVSGELVNGKYVEIAITKPINKMLPSDHYYVVAEYLSAKIVDYKEFTGKYFVVLNVATETIRIYEKQCADFSCPHKMIMESEVVVGEDKDHPAAEKGKGRTVLGSYRLTGWAKFYQDSEGHYPSWYKEGYPELPSIDNNDWGDWFKNKVMPLNAVGKRDGHMRGAFGWYAGFQAPNPLGQWTHGTVGWGSDKDKYIKKTKKFLTNIVSDPRSSGCTRNNNEAIAFIRQIVDTGAPMIKIYAKEALRDPSLVDYRTDSLEWSYILTKRAGEKADRDEVLKALNLKGEEVDAFWKTKRAGGEMIIDPKSPVSNILEVGTYTIDTQPTVIEYTPGENMGKIKRSVGRKGNVYGIKSIEMQGTFYVDAGMLSGYHHPSSKLEISGFEDEETPPFMDAKNLK
ncbi:MAG: L,D-transpeptidase family protein [Bacteriovorax sp.]|nr:L,D-transpeptidase family protein [Bacteriovorax sp.]